MKTYVKMCLSLIIRATWYFDLCCVHHLGDLQEY